MTKRRADPYRELFERSADAILIIEGDTFVDCNQATVEMLRCSSKEEVLRTHPSELSPLTQPDGRDSYEKANEMIAIAFDEGSHRFEWAHKRADGEVFPVEVLLTAVQRGRKRILHVVWRDVTERKRLEEQLRQSQKMEAVGKLAGGIAHDFNNLLVAIIGHSDLLLHRLADRPELREHAYEIHSAGARAASLVKQLLAFSRKQELRVRVIDLRTVLGDLQRFLRRLIGEDLHFVTQVPAEPVQVEVDPVQIEQVIINLATNARDAMPNGGTLTIEVRRELVDSEASSTLEPLPPGPYAVIAVSDTGQGMDEETARRAFEPFFSTKGLGKGTGLGLATVYGIATQSRGGVDVHSVVGQGTTVTVYLPIAREEPAVSSEPTELSSDGGTETILVVEDEASVSNLVVHALRSKGYRVLLARDGREALALWERHEGAIDLVLSDIVMPHMSGPELVAELRERGHRPRVLFASGYTNDALGRLEQLGEEIHLIDKPFSAAEIVAEVRAALDR